MWSDSYSSNFFAKKKRKRVSNCLIQWQFFNYSTSFVSSEKEQSLLFICIVFDRNRRRLWLKTISKCVNRLAQWGQIVFVLFSKAYKFSRITYSMLNTKKSKLFKLFFEFWACMTCNAHKEIISLECVR